MGFIIVFFSVLFFTAIGIIAFFHLLGKIEIMEANIKLKIDTLAIINKYEYEKERSNGDNNPRPI